MDDRTFDRLAQAFARRSGRRSLLKGLLGFGGVAAGTAVDLGRAEAQRPPGPPGLPVTAVPCPVTRVCGDDCCKATEKCCNPPGPAGPVCLPQESCCRNADCMSLNDRPNCVRGVCNQQTHLCEPRDRCQTQGLVCCPGKTVGICYDPASECCADDECDAASCETCIDRLCTGCPLEQTCCSGVCCDVGFCCGGVCSDQKCCAGDEDCGPCGTCTDGVCAGACESPESCCVIGDLTFCVDLTVEGSCCTAETCGLEDPDLCLVSGCIDFQCQPVSECLPEVEQCCGNDTCVGLGQECP